MADSCRPVSRHGRFNASHDRSDVQYNDNLHSYSTVEYRAREDIYGSRQSPVVMETLDRPKTGRGFRRIRPPSRGGREEVFDETKTGRPSSRMGFRPDTYDRHDYDEFSRQEHPVQSDESNSAVSSPRGGNNSPAHFNSPTEYRHNSPSQKHVVGSTHRMSVSPHEEYLSAQSPTAFRLLSRETIHHRSPVRSSQTEHVNTQTLSGSPSYNGQNQQANFRQEEQVFDFEDRQYDHRHNGMYQHHSGNEQHSYAETKDQPSYGDGRPPSRDSPRLSRNRSYTENEEPPSGYAPILSGRDRYKYEHYQHANNLNTHDSEVLPVQEEPTPPPRPTSSRPRSSRPKSARKRPQSGKKRREEYNQSDDINSYNQGYDPTSTEPVRPHSSFLRYKPLPAIGSNEGMTNQERANELAEHTRQLHLQESFQPRLGSERIRPGSAAIKNIEPASNMQQPNSPAKEISLSGATLLNKYTIESDVQDNDSDQDESGSVNKIDDNVILFKPHKLPEAPNENETRLQLAIRLPDGKRVLRNFSVADKLEIVKQFAENEACSDLSNYHLSCNAPKALFTDLSQLIGEVGLVDRTLLFLVEKV